MFLLNRLLLSVLLIFVVSCSSSNSKSDGNSSVKLIQKNENTDHSAYTVQALFNAEKEEALTEEIKKREAANLYDQVSKYCKNNLLEGLKDESKNSEKIFKLTKVKIKSIENSPASIKLIALCEIHSSKEGS